MRRYRGYERLPLRSMIAALLLLGDSSLSQAALGDPDIIVDSTETIPLTISDFVSPNGNPEVIVLITPTGVLSTMMNMPQAALTGPFPDGQPLKVINQGVLQYTPGWPGAVNGVLINGPVDTVPKAPGGEFINENLIYAPDIFNQTTVRFRPYGTFTNTETGVIQGGMVSLMCDFPCYKIVNRGVMTSRGAIWGTYSTDYSPEYQRPVAAVMVSGHPTNLVDLKQFAPTIIENYGQIVATASDGNGIQLDGTALGTIYNWTTDPDQYTKNITRVTNYGLIRAPLTAIWTAPSIRWEALGRYVIDNKASGLIEGKVGIWISLATLDYEIYNEGSIIAGSGAADGRALLLDSKTVSFA